MPSALSAKTCQCRNGEECSACIREPALSRTLTPTLPLERPIEHVELSFDDREACARVLEKMAAIVRTTGKLIIG